MATLLIAGAGSSVLAQPANDDCSNATVISPAASTFHDAVNTRLATKGVCDGTESCVGLLVGFSHPVWYKVTPASSGTIVIDTFGSSYDTVLSVLDRCGLGNGNPFCAFPNQLACNDNAGFGTLSEIYFPVIAGEEVTIKVAARGATASGGPMQFNYRFIPANDACADATEIVGLAHSDTGLFVGNASVEPCDARGACEPVVSNESIWYSYTPDCDGLATIDAQMGFAGSMQLSVFDGCSIFLGPDNGCDDPNQIACDNGAGDVASLVDVPLKAGTEYRIKVASPSFDVGFGLNFDFRFQPAGAPDATINSPADGDCVCDGPIAIHGTVDAVDGPLLGWTLDVRPLNTNTWAVISSGTDPIAGGLIGTWNTNGLSDGHYLLRLTVEGSCGQSASQVVAVFLDKVFANQDFRSPQTGAIIGGIVCVDGTAWDQCFDKYEVRIAGSGGSDLLVGPVTTTVINDPLVPGGWDSIAAGLPDGAYSMTFSAIDDCGHLAEQTHDVVLDNTAPVANIVDPTNCETIEPGLLTVFGTANDANLSHWALQYAGGPVNNWTTIAQGATPVVNGVLGVWDTNGLPDCAYALRLVVVDSAVVNCDDPHVTETIVTLNIDTASCAADINGNGIVDINDLAMMLSQFGLLCP